MQIAVARMSVEVGALSRYDFVSNLRSFCHTNGIDLKMKEDKGFLASTYHITLEGDVDVILGIKNWIKSIAD